MQNSSANQKPIWLAFSLWDYVEKDTINARAVPFVTMNEGY
ncbi:MAG: hypothetical protein QE277_05930 [Flectobacillus sp.]|nr:hypothetical protein [Flectobacillus sp.]